MGSERVVAVEKPHAPPQHPKHPHDVWETCVDGAKDVIQHLQNVILMSSVPLHTSVSPCELPRRVSGASSLNGLSVPLHAAGSGQSM
ncbi:MAG: hypothetical protein QW815_08175 [Nitrososphaerota archaeon]